MKKYVIQNTIFRILVAALTFLINLHILEN